MAQHIGPEIYKLRNKIDLSQTDFGALFGTTAMTVSRWERGLNEVPSRALLALGLLAQRLGMYGWCFWQEVGLTRAEAREMLQSAPARAAAAGRLGA